MNKFEVINNEFERLHDENKEILEEFKDLDETYGKNEEDDDEELKTDDSSEIEEVVNPEYKEKRDFLLEQLAKNTTRFDTLLSILKEAN